MNCGGGVGLGLGLGLGDIVVGNIALLASISILLTRSANTLVSGLTSGSRFQHSNIKSHTSSVIHLWSVSGRGRFGVSGPLDILVMTWISRLISMKGISSVKHSSMVMAKEYTSHCEVGEEMVASRSSGDIHRAEPCDVKVIVADCAVVSSRTLDMPKSHMTASPYMSKCK